jgi:hypothetical protein
MWYIYFLQTDQKETYVGRTSKPALRKEQHEKRLGPVTFYILEVITSKEDYPREKYWIAKLRPSLNYKPGSKSWSPRGHKRKLFPRNINFYPFP